ncbi:hypothetical protein VPH35_131916 [Triticum aestivum]
MIFILSIFVILNKLVPESNFLMKCFCSIVNLLASVMSIHASSVFCRSGSTAASTTKVVIAAASGASWWLRDSTTRLIYVLSTNPASFGLAGHYFEFMSS